MLLFRMELTRISSSCRPLSAEAPFSHVAAILRVSSPDQLDLAALDVIARQPTPLLYTAFVTVAGVEN